MSNVVGGFTIDEGPQCYATGIAFTIIAGVAVILRFVSKAWTKVAFGVDDWLILIAYPFFFAEQVLQLVAFNYVLGYSQYNETTFMKYGTISTFFYFISAACLKIGVLFYYRRIFTIQRFRTWTWILITIILLWATSAFFVDAFACVPLNSTWDLTVQGECIVYLDWYRAVFALEIALDTAIVLLPIQEVMRLQMPTSQKFLVSGIFLLGGFVIITNIVRITWASLTSPNKNTINEGVDVLGNNIHAGTSFLCACLPTYSPLVFRFTNTMKSVWSSFTSGSTKGSSPGSSASKQSISSSKWIPHKHHRSLYEQSHKYSSENYNLVETKSGTEWSQEV